MRASATSKTSQRTLGKEKTAEFARLYTAPGVDHVGSGAPANIDMLGVLVDWVENGKAPGDLEVTEQKVEAPAFETTAFAAAVPVAGMAALQGGTADQSGDEVFLRAVIPSATTYTPHPEERPIGRVSKDAPTGVISGLHGSRRRLRGSSP